MAVVQRFVVDVVVLGAGTAGANAAGQLAERGLRVVLLERRAATDAGAQWHNGVLDWQFVAAGVDPPVPPERAPSATRTHIVGPDGTHGVTVHDTPVVRADMALLGRRLRSNARQAGVELLDHVGRIDLTSTATASWRSTSRSRLPIGLPDRCTWRRRCSSTPRDAAGCCAAAPPSPPRARRSTATSCAPRPTITCASPTPTAPAASSTATAPHPARR
ncbi:MAG: FAD-dependent oxidoreductase [Acidimicrobiales bacterium]